MRRIRTDMWAVTFKGRFMKTRAGGYIMFPKKKDALELTGGDPDCDVKKVTLTITPKDKP